MTTCIADLADLQSLPGQATYIVRARREMDRELEAIKAEAVQLIESHIDLSEALAEVRELKSQPWP